MSDVRSVICPPGKAIFFVARKGDTQSTYWSYLLFTRINIVGSGNSLVCTKKKGPATVVTIQRPRDGGHQQQQPQRSAVALKKKVNPAVQKAMKEDDETTSPESGNENGGRKRHPGGRYER